MRKTSLLFVAAFILFLLPISVSAANHGNNSQSNSCLLKPGNFYTHKTTKSIWQVVPSENGSCTKRPVKSSKVYFTYENSWDAVKTVSADKIKNIKDSSLGFLPWGPKYNPKGGALLKTTDDNKVYLLLNDKKYWITDKSKFQKLNYKWSWIEDVDSKLLKKYKSGGQIDFTDHHPAGSLVKYSNSDEVYRLEKRNGKLEKRPIANQEVFNKLGYRFNRVVTINDGEAYSTGTPITLDNLGKIIGEKSSSKNMKKENNQETKNLSINLYPAQKNGKWGYIDKKGNWKIEPRFNYAKPFFEGRAAVNVITSTTFDDKKSKWGVVDKSGQFIVKPEYYSTAITGIPRSPIGHYSEGLAPVNARSTFGSYKKSTGTKKVFYFNKDGNKKLSGKFKKVGQFSDGLAPILNKNDEIGYIDKQGNIVIQPQYGEGLTYANGLIPVKPKGKTFGGWKFVDKQNNVVLPGPYGEARSFHNGLAKVEENDEMKYINTKGETVFSVDSFGSDNTSFWEDRAIVTKSSGDFDSYKAIVDLKGNVVSNLSNLDSKVCAAEPYHNGLAQIILSSDGFCSNSKSRSTSEAFLDAAKFSTTSVYAYIDKQGNIVYKGKPGSRKLMNSVSETERKSIKQLFNSSKTAVESENWKEYLKKYTKKGRSSLLKKYYTSLAFAVVFLGESDMKQEKIDKIKNKWKQLLKDFNLANIKDKDSSKDGESQLKKKFNSMSLQRKSEFLSRIMGLFKEAGEDKKPQFGNLIDFKIEGNKGAILIEKKESDGGTEEKSKTIIKENGNWKWNESF